MSMKPGVSTTPAASITRSAPKPFVGRIFRRSGRRRRRRRRGTCPRRCRRRRSTSRISRSVMVRSLIRRRCGSARRCAGSRRRRRRRPGSAATCRTRCTGGRAPTAPRCRRGRRRRYRRVSRRNACWSLSAVISPSVAESVARARDTLRHRQSLVERHVALARVEQREPRFRARDHACPGVHRRAQRTLDPAGYQRRDAA